MAVSWVRKVRHVQDLAPWKRHVFWKGIRTDEELDRRWDEYEEKQCAFFERLAPFVDRAHRPYFVSLMYDSFILRIKHSGGKLTLTMNSLSAEHFAKDMDDLFETAFYAVPWTVHLVAHNVTAFRIVKEDYNGQLRTKQVPVSLLRGREVNDPQHPRPYYVRDFGRRMGNRLEWVVEMDDETWRLVDCGRLTARDDTRMAVTQRFGPTIRQVYDELLGFRRSPLPLPHRGLRGHDNRDYVVARVKSLGLTQEDVAVEICEQQRVRG